MLVLCGGRAAGTGFFVGEGRILTCAHVLKGAQLSVSTCYGSSSAAREVKSSPAEDLALLSVEATGATVELVRRPLPAGTEVAFAGCPFPGLFDPPLVMTNRTMIGNRYQLGVDHYVLDAVVGEGYSGGPVFLPSGEVVGMISSRFDPIRGAAGRWSGAPISSLAFALTSKSIHTWLEA